MAAQERPLGTAVDRAGMAERGPLAGGLAERMLAQADALELSVEQRARLTQIRDRTASEAEPIMARLRATVGGEMGRGWLRDATPEQREVARELMGELRTVHRSAMTDAREVLTEAQTERLRELRPDRRRGAPPGQGVRGMRGERGERGMRAGPGMRGDRGERGARPGAGAGIGMRGGMAAFALEHADAVGLTADQRTRLEALVEAAPPRTCREEWREAMRERHDAVTAILTAEQLEQLRSMVRERAPRRGAGWDRGAGGGS
jgi:hypothetical protein